MRKELFRFNFFERKKKSENLQLGCWSLTVGQITKHARFSSETKRTNSSLSRLIFFLSFPERSSARVIRNSTFDFSRATKNPRVYEDGAGIDRVKNIARAGSSRCNFAISPRDRETTRPYRFSFSLCPACVYRKRHNTRRRNRDVRRARRRTNRRRRRTDDDNRCATAHREL